MNLKDLYPSFRGNKLNKENFNESSIEEISFLIANKKNESFKLLIDKIEIN
ncbi:MAG: CIA30 family protein [Flavobacteriales bacterium]|nr:CIA30 family protein [Flavobacteriales bacterium]